MHFSTAAAIIGLVSLTVAAPLAKPDGTLGGVVDAVAPITGGLGVTLNQILGFKDSDSSSGGSGSSGSSGGAAGSSSGGGGGSAVLGGVVDSLAPVTGGLG
ncbi:hypothetical protein IWW36_005655, partial [Coemansia brasiliensis]